MNSYNRTHKYDRQPKLVRTSSLDTNYIRNNLSLINNPVKLLFEKDHMELTKNWNEEETSAQRRLVKFDFIRLSASDYLVNFKPIKKSEFTNDAAIISCIFWEEKELHIVTSVDIILLLEYIIQDSFSIEEKNRIRRNLQSLKPITISRLNKTYQRFFQLLMTMEDPRPRNIEKDLKVFKWSDLFKALSKVISKYTSNNATINVRNESNTTIPIPNSKLIINSENDSITSSVSVNNYLIPNFQNDSLLEYIPPYPYQTMLERSSILEQNTAPLCYDMNSNSNHLNSSDSTNAEKDQFVPSERLKVMKRKHNLSNYNSNLHIKHQVYEDGIKPSEPKRIETFGETFLNEDGKGDKFIKKFDDVEMESSDSISTAGDASSTYAITSSDDQIGDRGSSLKNSNFADGSSDDGSGFYSHLNMVHASSQNSSSQTESNSQKNHKNGETGLALESRSASFGTGLFSNAKNNSQNTFATSQSDFSSSNSEKATRKHKKKSNKNDNKMENKLLDGSHDSQVKMYSNVNNFTADQSNRIFGPVMDQSETVQQVMDPQHLYNNQHPPQSHLYKGDLSNEVKLPYLEEYFTSNSKLKIGNLNISRENNIKLPPIINYRKRNSDPSETSPSFRRPV